MSKKKNQSNSAPLFKEVVVSAEPDSGKLIEIEYTARDEPVTFLVITFEDDVARRQHFTE
jgi:hypothetical protein